MIPYDPGYWALGFSFSLKGSVLPKSLAWAVPCGATTLISHILFHKHFDEWTSQMTGAPFISSLTFVMGFLIVFRVTQAYSRWWEGGTLLLRLRGEWFNAFSSLIALCNPDPDRAPEVVKFQHSMVRLVSLLYGTALMQVNTMASPSLEIIDIDGFDEQHMQHLEECHDKVEIVLQWIQKSVIRADAEGVIKAAPPILTRVYNQLGMGMTILSGARKISEFPIPFPIAQQITLMLQMQWIITPLISTMTMGSSSWAAMLAFASTLCLWSMNYLAVELEMPFGDDLNDLPMQHLQADMNASLIGLMDPKAVSPPAFNLQVSEQGHASIRTELLAINSDGQAIVMKPGTKEYSSMWLSKEKVVVVEKVKTSKCPCLTKAKAADAIENHNEFGETRHSCTKISSRPSGKKIAAVRRASEKKHHSFHIGHVLHMGQRKKEEKAKTDLTAPTASSHGSAKAHGAPRAHVVDVLSGLHGRSLRQAEDSASIQSTAAEDVQPDSKVETTQVHQESKSEVRLSVNQDSLPDSEPRHRQDLPNILRVRCGL